MKSKKASFVLSSSSSINTLNIGCYFFGYFPHQHSFHFLVFVATLLIFMSVNGALYTILYIHKTYMYCLNGMSLCCQLK